MLNGPIDVSSGATIVKLIDELKYQLKAQGTPSQLRADLSRALSRIIKKHNLGSDPHNYAVLPPGWEPKPFWYCWRPFRAWRWLTSLYWIYVRQHNPWRKESKNPAPTFKMGHSGGDLLRYNIPVTKIIEDNAINDLQDTPRRYIRLLLSIPWHPSRTSERDILDWGFILTGRATTVSRLLHQQHRNLCNLGGTISMPSFSPEAAQEYVESGGDYCPYCNSANITAGASDWEGNQVSQKVVCEDCGCVWYDWFKLDHAQPVEAYVAMKEAEDAADREAAKRALAEAEAHPESLVHGEELDRILKSGGAVKLPDGSGVAVGSWPLPKDHWLYDTADNNPPSSDTGMETYDRTAARNFTIQAAKYAIRSATQNGKITDFDPDAMVQAFLRGMSSVAL